MTSKVNEFGDKVGKTEICQSVLLFVLSLGMAYCACIRGCQEFKKNKPEEAPKIHPNQTLQIQR